MTTKHKPFIMSIRLVNPLTPKGLPIVRYAVYYGVNVFQAANMVEEFYHPLGWRVTMINGTHSVPTNADSVKVFYPC